MKKVLIIGGTASICDGIIPYLENTGYEISMLTYRNKEKINNKYNWKHLDLSDYNNVDEFINNLSNNYYDKVILTPTQSTGPENVFETKREDLINLYSNFIVNYMILIRELFKKITLDGHIIYISSTAANRPINDVNYAAAKGVIQTFVRSMSTKIKHQQTIFSIAPGLIYDTIAFRHNSPDYYDNDISKLASKEKIAQIIVEATNEYNGKIINLGFDSINY